MKQTARLLGSHLGRNLFQNETGITGFLRKIFQDTVASLLGTIFTPVNFSSDCLCYHGLKNRAVFSSFLSIFFKPKENKMHLAIKSNLFREGNLECGGKQMHACWSHSYSLTCQSPLFQKQLLWRLAKVLFRESISQRSSGQQKMSLKYRKIWKTLLLLCCLQKSIYMFCTTKNCID